MKPRSGCGAVLALAAMLAGAASADAHGLTLGFRDLETFEGPQRMLWCERADALGAGIVRLTGRWSKIAPAARASRRDARDRAEPAYRRQPLDSAVRAAAAQGLQILLTVNTALAWAVPARAAACRPARAAGASRRRVASRAPRGLMMAAHRTLQFGFRSVGGKLVPTRAAASAAPPSGRGRHPHGL